MAQDPNINPQTQFRPGQSLGGSQSKQGDPINTDYTNQYTIEEFIDVIQGDLTVSCSLPKLLPDDEIRRIVCNNALPWFYQNYMYAVQKMYFFINNACFESDEWTDYSYIQMPEEIQTITWLYPVRDVSLFQIGINAPNLSVNLGVTNQPYISSYVTTIGELGVYKTILDSFSDMLDQLSKHTARYQFNQMNHRLNVLTNVDTHMIAESYANVPQEHLFADPMFIKYVTGESKKQMGNLLTRYNFNLPGGVQYNGDAIIAEGKEERDWVIEQIQKMSTSSFFFMVKR